MSDPRQGYKALALSAVRSSVESGLMSLAYEDFLIDNLDRMVDKLDGDQFLSVMQRGKVPVNEIGTDEQYDDVFESIQEAERCLGSSDLKPIEREALEKYVTTLRELADEFKEREWG